MIKRRRLPHLQALNQPLFITFRLYGTLPPNRPFPAATLTSGQAFLTMDRLLDQARYGPAFLKQPPIADLVLTSMQHGIETNRFDLHAWVIMPNHIHLLLTPRTSLSTLLGALKAKTANRANLLLQRRGHPFWQDESYDHLVRNNEEFLRILRYIENNPVAASLAATPQDYPWSSAFVGQAPGLRRPPRPPEPRKTQPPTTNQPKSARPLGLIT